MSTTLTTVLDRSEIPYERLEHARTQAALAEAKALGISPEKVAKTIVVSTPDGFVRVAIPASHRLDMHKLRAYLRGGHEIRLATEAELACAYPEFELGAVPPVGGSRRDPLILDRRLARAGTLVVEDGAHDRSLRLWTADLLVLADAELGDVSVAAP
jgi:prolyl-tRNA editing enzyme YbaK/EbsC (Cys-tRNA(Pro) deacylase)